MCIRDSIKSYSDRELNILYFNKKIKKFTEPLNEIILKSESLIFKKKFYGLNRNLSKLEFRHCTLIFSIFGKSLFKPLFEKITNHVLKIFPNLELFKEMGLTNVSQGSDLAKLRKYFVYLGFVQADPVINDAENIVYVPIDLFKLNRRQVI